MNVPFFPEQASLGAPEVDALVFWLSVVTVFFLLVTAGPILFFCFRYRAGTRVNRQRNEGGTILLELAWTVIPFFIALALFAANGAVYYRQRHAPASAMEIHVIGKQWMWKVQHPQGRREINELHLPANVPVRLLMTSQDVIHSFYIPAFRLKQDVLPGRYTIEWMTPSRPGRYHLFCAEYCGTDHSRMIGTVIVLPKAGYEQWLAAGEEEESPALAGARRFRELGCSGCHMGSPVVHAPNLAGLFGRAVPLQDGRVVTADERYLRDSILLPQSEIAAGYAPVMPSYRGQVSEEDLFALIAYLKTLGRENPREGAAPP